MDIYTNDDGTEVEELGTFLEFGSATIFIMTHKEDPAGDKDIESAIIMDGMIENAIFRQVYSMHQNVIIYIVLIKYYISKQPVIFNINGHTIFKATQK